MEENLRRELPCLDKKQVHREYYYDLKRHLQQLNTVEAFDSIASEYLLQHKWDYQVVSHHQVKLLYCVTNIKNILYHQSRDCQMIQATDHYEQMALYQKVDFDVYLLHLYEQKYSSSSWCNFKKLTKSTNWLQQVWWVLFEPTLAHNFLICANIDKNTKWIEVISMQKLVQQVCRALHWQM